MTQAKGDMPGGRERAALTPEWRRWVVENLLRGAEAEDLVAVLERAGVGMELARSAVHAEAEDPIFQGAARAVAMQRKLEGLLDLYGALHRQAENAGQVDRHAVLSPEDFFERYYFKNLPVVTRATVLAELTGETLERLAAHARAFASSDAGEAPRAVVVPPTAPWDARLRVSSPVGLVADGAAPGLWWDEAGAEVALSPSRRNLLLCQVRGRRLLQLVPAFALLRVRGASSVPEGVPCLDVELSSGDMVLLPVGWWFAHRSPEGGAALCFESFAAQEPNVSWAPRAEAREPTPPPRSPVG